ncbi:DUF3883 domain-containing protein [Magnetospirillum sp. SS-4]|uniref:DUF3883 domain-containing protein n=1 Tax=Magnetospirillum sp. SS-4 TaxID=2681465 RepID=UPI0013857DDF|nr:DUF3883 domain-containing protein [Magnetospirillum sp. SS-4]CAA7618205.1 conserved hypothetical protein [Magnetospirillum sp. SS-4]
MSPEGTTSSSKSPFIAKSLRAFEKGYDPTREDMALQTRGAFLDAFPIDALRNLAVDDYVIGLQRPTFCYHVEVQTRAWAIIQGATAAKFGIYYGRTKSDPKNIYRPTPRFGKTKGEAFKTVKSALIDLVALGGQDDLDFEAIDANSLSQMFKAKILSLYFPDRFVNVCSHEHLEMFASELGYQGDGYVSEYQHYLVSQKLADPVARTWSNPKFMAFLYATYLPGHGAAGSPIRKPTKKRPGTVDFKDLQAAWARIGRQSEKFARKWEEERLRGRGWPHLAKQIDDRRNRPGYGYDFLSFSSPDVPRFIEVKTVGKVRGGGCRCFVSETEYNVSKSPGHATEYYFYLVSLGSNGKPASLKPVRAEDQYENSELLPVSYEMRFDLD